ncbi:MAG: HD domain-containing protein [Fluviicola sp.]|nr:HD domain-containing protein [Fluviicola sp.]
MNSTEIVSQIKSMIQKQFENESTGHDWFHIERVYNMAAFLQKTEGGDLEIIELSALLHDVSDHKFNGGSATLGGDIAFEKLINLNYSSIKAEKVREIINQVSFKGANVEHLTSSIEAKIVQDADRLDAIGAIGIARAFAYGGNKERPLYDPSIPPILHDSFDAYKNAKSHTINHFHEKLLLLRSKLNTRTAINIGNERHEFLELFLKNFMNEWNFSQ